MNPLSFSRAVKNSCVVLKSSRWIARDFSSLIACRSLVRPVIRGYAPLRKAIPAAAHRGFSSSGSSFNLPTRTFTFFVLSSAGIIGGFYVISYSLRVRFGVWSESVAIERVQGNDRSRRAMPHRY